MKEILFAALKGNKNLGDAIISDCTQWLVKEELDSHAAETSFRTTNLTGLIDGVKRKSFLYRKFYWNQFKFLGSFIFKLSLRKEIRYYCSEIKDASLIIIVGGGVVKYKYQFFWKSLSGIIYAAQKYNLPVVLNAVGIEGYEEQDKKCQILKKALNQPNVKMITSRDDLELLNKKYLNHNKNIITRKVADSAVFASSVYSVKKNLSSEIIGVGLVRGGIFKDNERNISQEDLICVYVAILEELEKKNKKWQLFTNGLPADAELADDILKKIGQTREVKEPKTAKELVETIAQFKGVIAARLHACITSYSLDIPVVGLIWNSKLPLFGETIGYPDRFISPEDFNGQKIVGTLETALSVGYDKKFKHQYKKTVRESLKEGLQIAEMI